MYAALLGVAVASGAPPLFSALMLGFFGNLLASTHTIVVDQRLYYTQLAMLHKSAGGL